MAHVAQWKENQVQDMISIMSEKPVIGLINIKGIPGPQMQKMRLNLRNKATLRISKIKLISLALQQMDKKKQGIKALAETLEGQIALIATDMNPFKLFQVLEQSKTSAPVKGGENAPEDIEIKAGETSFKPGPIVGELQRVGIPAAIEQGKVVIKADKTVVKAGEVISRDLAQMLTRLEIHPLTVGLDLRAVFENGIIFKKADLDVDPQQYLDDMALGANYAFNLAFNINYLNPVTIIPLLQTAQSRAMNLLFNANIISPVTIEHMLQNAQGRMMSLAMQLSDDALDDELKAKKGSAASAVAKSADSKEEAGPTDDKKDEEKDKDKDKEKSEEPEVSEEEAAAGLGALFG